MTINKHLINFHISLFIVLGISFFFHHYFVNSPHLLSLYALNFSIAIFVYWLVFLLRNKQKESLGYYFLVGTLVKFLVFFLLVLPIFKTDNMVSKIEFFSFFTPYLLSLFVETKSLISLLNSVDE
jgi:hypothetical protein